MADLENQYKADASGLDTIQHNLQTLQVEMFGKLGLSVDKADVNVTPDGDVTLVEKPEVKK